MKQFVSIIIIILTCLTLNAQKLSIGSEFGFISSVNSDYKLAEIENRRNTYYVGLNINYNINNKLEFTSGLHYLRQGYKHSTCYTFKDGVKNELVGKLDYLILPIALNIYIGKSNKFFTTIGLYNGVNMKAAQDYPDQIGGCEIYYPKDISNVTQKYLFGGMFGFGYKFFENDKINLNSIIRYYQGFNNIMKNPYNDDLIWKDKYSSLLISLTFNYKM